MDRHSGSVIDCVNLHRRRLWIFVFVSAGCDFCGFSIYCFRRLNVFSSLFSDRAAAGMVSGGASHFAVLLHVRGHARVIGRVNLRCFGMELCHLMHLVRGRIWRRDLDSESEVTRWLLPDGAGSRGTVVLSGFSVGFTCGHCLVNYSQLRPTS